jgi:anti-sigma factor RsiW
VDCAAFESTLADYLDGTLDSAGRAAIEQHAAGCAVCREFMREVSGAVTLLADLSEAEPPQELVTRIAFLAPQWKTRDAFEEPGFWERLKTNWLQPILQPRWVMGMAMTVLSFAMLERCTGVRVQHVQAADLDPVRVVMNLEDKAVRAKDRMVKNYENLRVVYEIESRLTEVQNAQDAQPQPPKDKTNGETKPEQGERK